MTVYVRHALRALGLPPDDRRAAESTLGRRHRLTRTVANLHTVARQSLVAISVALLAGGTLILHLGFARLFVGAALVVGVAFALAWAVTYRIARERAQELIASGGGEVAVSVVARERRRLASPRARERLARSLEEHYRDALRWHQIFPGFRPPSGVQQLRDLPGEVKGLTTALRRDRVRVQGVALAERLITNGHESPLYGDRLGPLREELNRIRFLLDMEDAASDDRARRAA